MPTRLNQLRTPLYHTRILPWWIQDQAQPPADSRTSSSSTTSGSPELWQITRKWQKLKTLTTTYSELSPYDAASSRPSFRQSAAAGMRAREACFPNGRPQTPDLYPRTPARVSCEHRIAWSRVTTVGPSSPIAPLAVRHAGRGRVTGVRGEIAAEQGSGTRHRGSVGGS